MMTQGDGRQTINSFEYFFKEYKNLDTKYFNKPFYLYHKEFSDHPAFTSHDAEIEYSSSSEKSRMINRH